MVAMSHWFYWPPLPLCSSFIVSYLAFCKWCINYVILSGVYGRGFPVDSFPCIYLMFVIPPFSPSLISYFAWLVCGWSQTRETWLDGFFPDASGFMEVFLYHS